MLLNIRIVDNIQTNLNFKNMYDRVDIDEKWFYMTRAKENYFLVCGDNSDDPDESHPVRRTQNKHYIEKVLFCVHRHIHCGMLIGMLIGMAS